MLNAASNVTGFINGKYAYVAHFLQLEKENVKLQQQIVALNNKIVANQSTNYNNIFLKTDSLKINDSTTKVIKYQWLPAEVTSNSVSKLDNYIQVNRGALQGVKTDMALITANAEAVGRVVGVTDNYSIVMSLLHKGNTAISASLKNSIETGTIEWDGVNPSALILKNIPKIIPAKIGDSVLVSRYSTAFPPGTLIGTISELVVEKEKTNYSIKVKPAANFFNIRYVYVVANKDMEELQKLEEIIHKNE